MFLLILACGCLMMGGGVAHAADDGATTPDTDEEIEKYQQLLSDLGWGDEDEGTERRQIYEEFAKLQADIDATTDKLQENYDAMKANEQSTANKLIGAAGMASVGIGGMELASGLAEKNADEDAERDMRAYLETIKCDYGQGLNIRGGETNIELPGGNELAELYSQYTALAADLKARKESLGLKPGLESELILDKASTGLYDDVGIGITSGAYASVSRALMDENGDDAAAWNAQKEESQKKIKAGAIAAGVGAVGTLAANLAVNANAPKEKSAEILQERDAAKKKLQDLIHREVESCNTQIAAAKKLADEISANTRLAGDAELAKFIAAVRDLTPLADDADIIQIKEHPLCR